MPPKNAPRERTCIVTRQAKQVDAMIRFVIAPDGSVVADLRRRLPGRGVWVTADRGHVVEAARSRRLYKMLGATPADRTAIADQVDGMLMSAAVGALSLARKAGAVTGGFTKVEEAIGKGTAIGLIHATDAGGDGQAKLGSAVRRSGRPDLPVIRLFAPEHLDLAFGRTNVIHAALLAGRAGENVLEKVADLVRYRGGQGSDSGDGIPGEESGRADGVSPGH